MVVLVGVAGCGADPADSSADKDPDRAASAPSSQASPDSAENGADPQALGIDMAQWPEDRPGVKALLDQMPDRVAGKPMNGRPMVDGTFAQVSYGPANKGGITILAATPNGEVKDPQDQPLGHVRAGICVQQGQLRRHRPLSQGRHLSVGRPRLGDHGRIRP